MTPVLIVLITFVFVLGIIKMNLDFKRDQMLAEGPSTGADKGLPMSELKGLIQEAVEASNEPLREQLDELTTQLEAMQRQLPEAHAASPRTSDEHAASN